MSSSRSKGQFQCQKRLFCYKKLVDLFFLVTEKFISDIILMVQGHWQGQKINIKIHFRKYDF